ncbi:PhzF family phenazine biosynthesis protein [Thalassotalea litorea]|uniref:PhzF family phenazine biosynthesis protein n=1 Tax=Thalassotalea litorea TaxID=2020715 RepID=A0A5R9ISA2_9GAMM|nr:PhzF family phenazine biosynthesis protein [Thalassotalea litorea]TLU66171.1 PhzF family phenazine biosynthesis protein [Thalassotalea litorea]
MNLPIYIVNAFTDSDFAGNPAAVIPLKEWLSDDVMQNIAAQNNLSETAFIKRSAANRYDIRWFSPLSEIDFCGHASLASAFVLFNFEKMDAAITFFAKAVGEFSITQTTNQLIQMEFPEQLAKPVQTIPEALMSGLSIKPQRVLRNRQAYIAVYPSEQDIRTLQYDSARLKQLAPFDVSVTAPGENVDFVSRYFWPANGGDEDPVTGSIHAALAPFWSNEFNKTHLSALQLSSRTGSLQCQVVAEKVIVSGYAKLYLRGTIEV